MSTGFTQPFNKKTAKQCRLIFRCLQAAISWLPFEHAASYDVKTVCMICMSVIHVWEQVTLHINDTDFFCLKSYVKTDWARAQTKGPEGNLLESDEGYLPQQFKSKLTSAGRTKCLRHECKERHRYPEDQYVQQQTESIHLTLRWSPWHQVRISRAPIKNCPPDRLQPLHKLKPVLLCSQRFVLSLTVLHQYWQEPCCQGSVFKGVWINHVWHKRLMSCLNFNKPFQTRKG